MKKNQRWRGIGFLVAFVIVVWLLFYLGNLPGTYERLIRQAYSGEIVYKYVQKTTHIVIQTSEHDSIDVSMISDSLENSCKVGDSIEKLPDDDHVILTRDGIKIKSLYLYIPSVVRNDRRWPAEWKDLWYDDDRPPEAEKSTK